LLAAAAPEAVLVLPFTAHNVAAGVAPVLDQIVLSTFDTLAEFPTLGVQDLEAVLGLERMRDLTDCDAVSCMAEVSGAMGAARVVSGTVGMLGAQLNVSMMLVQARDVHVLGRAQETATGAEQYPEAVRAAVLGVLGHRYDPERWRQFSKHQAAAKAAQMAAIGYAAWMRERSAEQALWLEYLQTRANGSDVEFDAWKLSQAPPPSHGWAISGVVAGALLISGGVAAYVLRPAPADLDKRYAQYVRDGTDASYDALQTLSDRRDRMTWAGLGAGSVGAGLVTLGLISLFSADDEPPRKAEW
jgi:hypothetical protein